MIAHLNGSYYEQGKQLGRGFSQEIIFNIRLVNQLLEEKKADREQYLQYVMKQYRFTEQKSPEIAEQIEGIAEGACLKTEDVVLVNIPFYFFAERFAAECSVVVAHGAATLDGSTYMFKNRDMKHGFIQLVLDRTFPDGRRVIEEDVAGCVNMAGAGVNSDGLILGTTGVSSPQWPRNLDLIGKVKSALSPHSFLYQCSGVEDVLDLLKEKAPYKVSHSNLVVADEKRAAAIEVTESGYRVMESENGMLVRTNHFVTEDYRKYSPSKELYPSTYLRYERAASYLKEHYGKIRFQEMLNLASDHENGPVNCICRHGDGGGSRTLCMSIMNAQDRAMWTAMGNPCEAMLYTPV